MSRCHDRRWSEASKLGACRLKYLEVVCRSIDPSEPAISYRLGPRMIRWFKTVFRLVEGMLVSVSAM